MRSLPKSHRCTSRVNLHRSRVVSVRQCAVIVIRNGGEPPGVVESKPNAIGSVNPIGGFRYPAVAIIRIIYVVGTPIANFCQQAGRGAVEPLGRIDTAVASGASFCNSSGGVVEMLRILVLERADWVGHSGKAKPGLVVVVR